VSNDDQLNFKKYKPKKPKLAVPEEFLDNAKSYDDKVIVVKYMTEQMKGRVILLLKSMLKDAVAKRDKK
jgi:hypothetical protein